MRDRTTFFQGDEGFASGFNMNSAVVTMRQICVDEVCVLFNPGYCQNRGRSGKRGKWTSMVMNSLAYIENKSTTLETPS